MKQNKTALPRWVQWSGALVFLAVPLTMAGVSLYANVDYAWQYGVAAMIVAATSDVARFVLPVIAQILNGWTFFLRVVVILCGVFSAWTAVNFAADGRFQNMLEKSNKAEQQRDNSAEIKRLSAELNAITESGSTDALKAQLKTLQDKSALLTQQIDYESDPAKNGPCGAACKDLQAQLKVVQDQAIDLNAQLGRIERKAKIEALLEVARTEKKTTEVVQDGGVTAVAAMVVPVPKPTLDMAALAFTTVLYLLLVECVSYLIGYGAAAVMAVYASAPKKAKPRVAKPAKVEAPVIEKPKAVRKPRAKKVKQDNSVPKTKTSELKKLKLSDLPIRTENNVRYITPSNDSR